MGKPWWRHDIVMAVLGIVSVAMVFWVEQGRLTAQQLRIILLIDLGFVIWFLADWIMALREAEDRKGYLWGNWWKLLGMLPLYIQALGFLRLLRLVRIIYALDMVPPIHRFFASMRGLVKDGNVATLAMISGAITVVGAALVWLAERGTNPRLEEFSESLWWAIVTVTTVGYGDITPITALGRFVAVMLMVTGIGTIGLLASQVSAALIRHRSTARSEVDVADALATLAELHAQGSLDDREYAAAKQKVLR